MGRGREVEDLPFPSRFRVVRHGLPGGGIAVSRPLLAVFGIEGVAELPGTVLGATRDKPRRSTCALPSRKKWPAARHFLASAEGRLDQAGTSVAVIRRRKVLKSECFSTYSQPYAATRS